MSAIAVGVPARVQAECETDCHAGDVVESALGDLVERADRGDRCRDADRGDQFVGAFEGLPVAGEVAAERNLPLTGAGGEHQ